MQRITKFIPAYNRIDPDPSKNYGVGGVRCMLVLKGDKGAVHFLFDAGMHLQSTHEYWKENNLHTGDNPLYMGHFVGYHSPKQQFEGQEPNINCDWLDGKPCYSDGSSLKADEFMNVLVEEGSDKIWEMLEAEYINTFGEDN